MKSLILLKRVVTAFFIIVFSPIISFFRFIFFKILVKIYLNYFSFIKKIGWDRFKGNVVAFLFSQKTVHILVIILTFSISFSSFVSHTKAKTGNEKVAKTIISSLVSSEFSEFGEDELIEEGPSNENSNLQSQSRYLNNTAILDNRSDVALNNNEEEETLADISSKRGEVIVKPEIATTKISKKTRKEAIEYVVEEGDTVSTIAYSFDVSVNTILWENNLSSYSLIRPGDKLIILPSTGIMHKTVSGESLESISKKYSAEVEKIIEVNNINEGSKLAIGQKLFVPGGSKYYYQAPVAVAIYNPISVIKDIVKPAGQTNIVASNKMAWPTDGAKITQYYSWRHNGLDIGNKIGTPIYASDAGTISYAGWKNGYGNVIIIDHGGGKETLYAHQSKFFVKKGAQVGKGEAIGAMGSTGWSTGSHLHFEVRINGKKYNPLNYIK